jgi:hypothetical protein
LELGKAGRHLRHLDLNDLARWPEHRSIRIARHTALDGDDAAMEVAADPSNRLDVSDRAGEGDEHCLREAAGLIGLHLEQRVGLLPGQLFQLLLVGRDIGAGPDRGPRPEATSIPAATQQALCTLEWVERGEDLCVCGPSVTGKSHFVEALGHLAIDRGKTVVWHTPESLEALLRGHRTDGSVAKAIRQADQGRSGARR